MKRNCKCVHASQFKILTPSTLVNTTNFPSMKLKRVYPFSKLIEIKLLCWKMWFVLFANPLLSINGTNAQFFTQPYWKSTLHSPF